MSDTNSQNEAASCPKKERTLVVYTSEKDFLTQDPRMLAQYLMKETGMFTLVLSRCEYRWMLPWYRRMFDADCCVSTDLLNVRVNGAPQGSYEAGVANLRKTAKVKTQEGMFYHVPVRVFASA